MPKGDPTPMRTVGTNLVVYTLCPEVRAHFLLEEDHHPFLQPAGMP